MPEKANSYIDHPVTQNKHEKIQRKNVKKYTKNLFEADFI
jgi:hypothetical protein